MTKLSKYPITSDEVPKDLFGNAIKPVKSSLKSEKQAGSKGLSLTLNLTARHHNHSECQVFMVQKYDKPIDKKKDGRTNQDKKGDRVQNGLTRRGRKTIRLISEQFNKLVLNHHDNDYHSYNVMGTLSYRKIIPSDKESKKHLQAYFKRLNRKVGKKVAQYLWVAERQKRGAIHYHTLTPESLSSEEFVKKRKILECVWINRVWNEIVCNWALKSGRINKKQSKQWHSELRQNERYNLALAEYYYGDLKEKPTKPKGSKYLLLPNIIHVFNVGAYMAKYMSKENENIIGGMYGASKSSREFLVPTTMIQKQVISDLEGNAIVMHIYKFLKRRKQLVKLFEIEYNRTLTLWCKKPYLVYEAYFDYIEKYGLGLDTTHPSIVQRKKNVRTVRTKKRYVPVRTV